ncbi:MAG: hypothetical protein Q4G30_00040 [Actinomycetaceae bacterium]|nr:hypothetical protein [Actinomycetaceae bacterium]
MDINAVTAQESWQSLAQMHREGEQEQEDPQVDKTPDGSSALGRVIANPQVFTVVVALMMGLTFWLPRDVLTVAAVAVVVGFSLGWAQLLRLPSQRGTGVVIALFGIVSVLAVRIYPDLAIVTEVAGVGILGAFIAEILRGKDRPQLVASVAGTIAGLLIALTAGVYSVLGSQKEWHFLVLPAALILVAGALVQYLPKSWSPNLRGFLSVAIAGAAGLVVGLVIMLLGVAEGANVFLFQWAPWPGAISGALVGASLGVIVGLTWWALMWLFDDELAPKTVFASFTLGTVPVLALVLPVYAMARLLGA